MDTQGNKISSICRYHSFLKKKIIWMISSDVSLKIPLSRPNETCTYTVHLGLHLTFSRNIVFFYLDILSRKNQGLVTWWADRGHLQTSPLHRVRSVLWHVDNGSHAFGMQWDLTCVHWVGDLCEHSKSNSLWAYCMGINQGCIPDTLVSLHFILSGKTWTEIW